MSNILQHLPAGEKVGIAREKFFPPFRQGCEQADVEIALDRGRAARAFKHRMVTQRQVKAAQATKAIRFDPERIDIEHRASMRRDHQVAVKPVTVRLLGPEEIELPGHPLQLRCGKSWSKKQIEELMGGNHDLDGVARSLVGWNPVLNFLQMHMKLTKPDDRRHGRRRRPMPPSLFGPGGKELVIHLTQSSCGFRFTKNSQLKKLVGSVPSSGRPSWLTTVVTSACFLKMARIWPTNWPA